MEDFKDNQLDEIYEEHTQFFKHKAFEGIFKELLGEEQETFIRRINEVFSSGSQLSVNYQSESVQSSVENSVFEGLLKSSVHEYIEMIMGRKSFTRGTDFIEFRLASLIVNLYDGFLPSEIEVGKLFHRPRNFGSTTLINTLTKYSFDLENPVSTGIDRIISTAQFNEGSFEIKIYSKYILEKFIECLEQEYSSNFPPIVKKKNTINTYRIPLPSYIFLYSKFSNRLEDGRPEGFNQQILSWWKEIFNVEPQDENESYHLITTNDEYLISTANKILAESSNPLEKIVAHETAINMYKIQQSAFDYLKDLTDSTSEKDFVDIILEIL